MIIIITQKVNKDLNGNINYIKYFEDGVILHNENGPAVIRYYDNGNIEAEGFYKHGNLHRLDGPAFISYSYYENQRVIREQYYVNGNIHRKNGPAVIQYSSNKVVEQEIYVIADLLHRLDGPAVIYYNENGEIRKKGYWINGREYEDILQYMIMAENLK